jgi:hypothetical protein
VKGVATVELTWVPVAGETLTLTANDLVPDAQSQLLRTAQSIRSDAEVAFPPSLDFGWLPSGLVAGTTSVRGQTQALWAMGKQGGSATVWAPLDDGLWLRVSGDYSQEHLVRVADTMTVGQDLTFPWLGRR